MPNNRRDLHVGIDADDRGFGSAFEDAKDKAQGLDKELAKVERQQAATEKVTQRTTAAVERFAKAEDKAALAAHRMGLEAKRAADQAERAEVRAAAAAEAAAKGLLDEEKAARIAARADQAVERAALKAAEAQLAEAAAAERAAESHRDAAGSVDRTRGLLVSAGAAAAALAVPVGAAGLAFVGMAAVAAPAIAKVISAQADLGANWDTLDKGQKVAAASVQSLITEYKALAKSYEPDALAQFNGLVATARGLLPTLDKTVASTRAGFADFSATVETSLDRQIPRLAGILQGQATPALHQLGVAAGQTTELAVNLVQGLAPMGLTLLTGASGALRLLNALTALDPRLTELAVTLLAVRGPANSLGNLWTSGATRLGKLGKTAAEAEGSVGKLSKTVGSSPNLYIGAALAVGYLALRWATAKDATDNFISSQKTANDAVGNNIAGWKAYAQALGNASVGQQTYNQNLATSKQRLQEIAKSGGYDPQKFLQVKKAVDEANKSIGNINAGAAALGKQFGISSGQAIQLATAAGVDLSKGITGSSKAAEAARAKISQYEAAVAAASNPTQRIADDMQRAANSGLLMADRMKAVDDALSAYYGPASAAFDATTQLKAGMDELAAAMKKAHGNFSGNTQASQDLRRALKQQLDTVAQLYEANLQTKGYDAARNAAQDQVQVMYALAGGSDAARGQIDALARSLGVTVGASHLSHDAFIAAAKGLGESTKEAEKLWRAYQRLQAPVKLKVNDAEFLDRLHNAQGLKIDPKTGLFLGNNADYFNKWLKAHGLKLDPKTGKFLGNNSDYLNKFLAANRLHIDTKTGKIVGNTSAFWSAVHAIPSTVATRYVRLITAHTVPHGADGGYIGGYADGGPARRFPTGGQVVGPGTATSDSIPAMLSNGEYVINAAATRAFRPLLDAINYGRPVPVAAAQAVSGASGGSSRDVSVSQTFINNVPDPHVIARESARELAWTLRG